MSNRKKVTATEAPQPERIPHAEVARLRAAPAIPPKTIKRPFFLDSPLGEVEVTVKGPAGAVKIQSTHNSLILTTGEEGISSIAAPVKALVAQQRRSAPQRVVNADPNEPSGASVGEPVDSLPGDDEVAERKAREVESTMFDFLRQGERALMRSVKDE